MERQIPKKNYFILLIVVIGFVLVVFYLRDWYNTTRLYYAETSPILEVSTVINENEISNYAQENPNFILYVSSDENKEIRKFDNDFKKLIIDNNITNVLYINIDENPNINNILRNDFANNKIANKIETKNKASLYSFRNGQIVDVIKDVTDYSAKDLEKKLQKNGMIDND